MIFIHLSRNKTDGIGGAGTCKYDIISVKDLASCGLIGVDSDFIRRSQLRKDHAVIPNKDGSFFTVSCKASGIIIRNFACKRCQSNRIGNTVLFFGFDLYLDIGTADSFVNVLIS